MNSPLSKRKPLATKSNTVSRLPTFGSRLKRPRSPDAVDPKSDGKKSKTDSPSANLKSKTDSPSANLKSKTDSPSANLRGSASAKKKTLRTSVSTSTLHKTRIKNPAAEASKERLRRANSSINLMKKPPVSQTKPISATPASGTTFKFQPPREVPKTSTAVRSRAPQSAVVSRTKPLTASQNLNSTVVSTGAPKKRPAWDLKGRMQDMEETQRRQMQEKTSMKERLTEYNGRIAQLESQNQQLSGDVVAKEMASESATKEISRLKDKLLAEELEFDVKKRRLESQIEDLEFQKSSLHRQKVSLEGELTASLQEVSGLKNTVAQLTSSQASIRAELDNTKIQLDAAFKDISSLEQTVNERDGTVSLQDEQIKTLEQKERQHETERRKLHNTIQELKGNIRVFCRVRPLLGDELVGSDGVIHHMNFPDMDRKVLELDKLSNISVNESMHNNLRATKSGSGRYEFNFDKVFQPETTQAEVFEEISQLVQSALDGYNVCIFAYGQTGSGKTHTMEGSLASEQTLGMIPRSVQQIFQSASELEMKGWKYTFKASMLEIYNETIRDLLGNHHKDEKLEIRLNDKGESGDVFVTNLTVKDVTSETQVLDLLHRATENRAVAETKCNERSSRSHSVFQLQLIGVNSVTGETSKGTLSLVDLAGSERVKDSGSEGQRLVEAQKINKSLSDLGNVILALGNKDKHVPYRNSKLTFLLQNSLGGNSKTLMFVNVSPKEECFSESLNSLRFATKVNQCNIGTAQKKK